MLFWKSQSGPSMGPGDQSGGDRATNLALKNIAFKKNLSDGHKENNHQKVIINTRIPGVFDGNCLVRQFYRTRMYLEKTPKARPGICTVIVGITLFFVAIVLALVNVFSPSWISFILIGSAVMIILIGSIKLFKLLRKNSKIKENVQDNKKTEKADSISIDSGCKSQRLELIGDTKTETVNYNLLQVPQKTLTKNLSFKHDIAHEIFNKYGDPLVLRTPTMIEYKCLLEFPEDFVSVGNDRVDVTYVDEVNSSDDSDIEVSRRVKKNKF